MTLLARRELLVVLGGLAAFACNVAPRREAVLRSLMSELLPPDMDNLSRRSDDLMRAAQRFSVAPSEPELTAVRAAFRRAALAWKRASAFRPGGLVESGSLSRAQYWPVRAAAVQALLNQDGALSSQLVAELGADVKGIHALEYLLFAPAEMMEAWLVSSDSAGIRARELIRLYAEDVSVRAVSARRELVTAMPRMTERLAQRADEACAHFAAMLLDNIEASLLAQFRLVLWLGSLGKLRTSDVQGGPSGISHELALAVLVATQRLYRGVAGRGFSDLVRAAAPRVDQHVDALFTRSLALVRALPAIEQAARGARAALEQATGALKELDMAFRDEVPGALGVTLTFGGIDAD